MKVVLVTLTKGRHALVDERDAEIVLAHKWHALEKDAGRYYAARTIRVDGRKRTVYLHRWLMGEPTGIEVDHANRNTLDCRRGNLRLATSSQQKMNTSRRAQCGFRGVTRAHCRWRASIQVGGKYRHLGVFDTPEEAASVYDMWAREIFGEFAATNFPREESL